MAKKAESLADQKRCFRAMNALRPHLTEESFLQLLEKMKSENYHLIYTEEAGEPVAVCGFRYITSLFEGSYIYIDDLSTLPDFQGKGYGDQLFQYVVNLAKKEGLNAVHLDSGHHRYDAHRFYLKHGMNIVYHHFRLGL